MSFLHGTLEVPERRNIMHKTSWTYDEIKNEFVTAETKKRWTNTQLQTLLERISELEEANNQLINERTFILTLLDESKIENESIRAAAEALKIKLPRTKRMKK